MYIFSDLISYVHGEKTDVQQKVLFAIVTGGILYPLYINLVGYFFYDTVSPSVYAFITAPNPLLSLLYCFLGIRILKLLPVRSIQIMGMGFHYYTFVFWFSRLLNSIILFRQGGRFNPRQESISFLVNLVIYYVVYIVALRLLKKQHRLSVPYKLHAYVSRKKELAMLLLKSGTIYISIVFFCIVIENTILANFLICLFLALFLALTLLYDKYQTAKADVNQKQLHIDSLTNASDEFRAIKHDFYNILQTYNGYFALQDYEACQKYHYSLVQITVQAGEALDLTCHLPENPTLVALLIEKRRKAQKLKITMDISLKCLLGDLPIAEMDMSRIMACLLDNAIEAATETQTRYISYTMEQKTPDTKLIIITNSTKKPMTNSQMFVFGKTNKEGHQGIGLNTVIRTIDRYGNCTFQISYFNNQMVAYLELKS